MQRTDLKKYYELFNMNYYLILSLISSVSAASNLSVEDGNVLYSSDGKSFYIYPKNSYYESVTTDEEISISPNRNYAILPKLEIGSFWNEDGQEVRREVQHCDLVDMRSGCVLETYSGEPCAAKWSGDDEITTSYGSIQIPDTSNQEEPAQLLMDLDYTDLEFSINSYKACYPLTSENENIYRNITEKLKYNYSRKD
ncbi:hypothetical protein DZA51_02885 [Vibrio campbellii]|nr:hypothetical protein DZA51_02885 [Vibrio campbellii]